MLHIIFLYILGLVWILFASLQDLKKREVANWINFSLIIFAMGFRFFYSFFSNDFSFFYQGFIGLGIFFVLGNLFYYGKIFAGGDAKLMIALGAILGFSNNFFINLRIYVSFLFLFFFIGAFYGMVLSCFFSLVNFKSFKKEFRRQFLLNKKIVLFILSLSIAIFLLGIYENFFLILGAVFFFLPYLYLYAKSVDEVCMVKKVDVKTLTEGDWLYEDVKYGKGFIKASWDGLTQDQIEKLRKKYKTVKIRQGIPFVPVFLISFICLGILFYFGLIDRLWDLYFY